MSSSGNVTKFLILCLVWGLTWIAVKVGVATVPPTLYAATRFVAAGTLLLAWAISRGASEIPKGRDAGRLLVASLLMITLCYGPLFWGMQFVASGTAAVLEMSLTPLALLAFGIALGEERWSTVRFGAMLIGVVGLAVLFEPAITATEATSPALFGLAAITWAAISSAWGSVLARPLVGRYGSTVLSGLTTLIGGCVLLFVSFVLEPVDLDVMLTVWHWQAIVGWFFLVVFGSLIGFRIYMQLLRDIGPARSGSFAFVSPAIAVGIGALVAGEKVTLQSVIGMILMALAAAVCLFAGETRSIFPAARKA